MSYPGLSSAVLPLAALYFLLPSPRFLATIITLRYSLSNSVNTPPYFTIILKSYNCSKCAPVSLTLCLQYELFSTMSEAMLSPPPGTDLNDNAQSLIRGGVVSTWILAIIAVVLRFTSRRMARAGFWVDDWLMLPALTICTLLTSVAGVWRKRITYC